jgi:hypothetical protein
MVLEFGAREDLPMRIALSTMVEGGVSALAPLIGGIVMVAAGDGWLIAAAAIMTVVALMVMLARVKDPRVRRADIR